MSDERTELVCKAKLAEQVERYEEMVEAMKKVVELGGELSVEERNLLSVAYKNVIGTRRSSWRIVSSIENKETNEAKKNLAIKYRKQFEKELKQISDEILELVKTHLLPNCQKDEPKVFYLKMQGDYYRYMAEFSTGDEKTKAAQNSLEAYQNATVQADTKLDTTNPIRLGLALNFSVFYYEIQNDPKKACELAKKSFDDAIAELDHLSEETYKDSTLIMQLLRDNLTLWTAENEDGEKANE